MKLFIVGSSANLVGRMGSVILGIVVHLALVVQVFPLDLMLQTRHPDTGELVWCKTATMRVDAFVPRINRALESARSLGMTVMLCPSDVVENYAGYPQREKVMMLPPITVPHLVTIHCPPVPDAGGCACGRERCAGNYGWDGMHPGLRIGPDDWMPDTQAEVFALCQQRGLTHLIYVGFHTQVCLLGKPMGLRAMKTAGLRCVLARDMTDAHPGYDPSRDFTPDLNTAQVVEHFEKHLSPTIHLQETLARAGVWAPGGPVDPVRVTPWGTPARPHLFEESVIVTLSAPLQPGAEIRYTLDGTAPSPASKVYGRPILLTSTTHLRATAYAEGQAVALESEGYFVRLAPLPPKPDVFLGDLAPVRSAGFGHTYGGTVRYSGQTQAPQKDRSNLGHELRINRTRYERGLGVHAPCVVAYALKPEFRRFVALAGCDEHIVSINHGSNLAKHPSVVFKVFIDGKEAAASPMMRVLSLAWRFDVAIPEGSRMISLVALDGGDGSREDFADWTNAGFVTQK
jgi:NPCBM/NEW2 domain/Chitobiase/beta-hexosaminidase C-terminal domain